jgi:hypothetical protein
MSEGKGGERVGEGVEREGEREIRKAGTKQGCNLKTGRTVSYSGEVSLSVLFMLSTD